MTTASTPTPTIVHKRRRRTDKGERHFLCVDGRDVRVRLETLIYVEFDYNAKTRGPVFNTDYMGTIYRYSDREWSDERKTFFYPLATREEAELFNAIVDEVANHSDLLRN